MRERILEGLQRRRRRERVVTASLLALLATVLLGWGTLRSPLLAVEDVRVVGVPGEVSAEVLDVASVRVGQNVLDVDLEAVEAQVTELSWVERATVRRRLPSTVEIRVSARTPVLAGTFGENTYLVDAEGLVIEVVDEAPEGVTTMALTAAPPVGAVVTAPSVLAAAEIAARMPPGMERWLVSYSTAGDDEVDALLRVPTESGPVELVAHLGRPVEVDVKAATIASLVEETVGNGMTPRALDVRIPDRPIVLA
ncbi:MAG: FtsQ-type POTRA domain-containing protein [Actinomycetota bacterium]|uniref:cell division protein FtsQ/DivIB n=1 Tax=Euzebya pacifica TaxID=1608957 RepID=UPI0030F5052C